MVHGQEGLVAVGTTLGWVLSGPKEIPGPTIGVAVTHTLHEGGMTNNELQSFLKSLQSHFYSMPQIITILSSIVPLIQNLWTS